jgi:hypothetical protein
MLPRNLVDYNDLEHLPISDDQYRANLCNQLGFPSISSDLTIAQLERAVDALTRGCA